MSAEYLADRHSFPKSSNHTWQATSAHETLKLPSAIRLAIELPASKGPFRSKDTKRVQNSQTTGLTDTHRKRSNIGTIQTNHPNPAEQWCSLGGCRDPERSLHEIWLLCFSCLHSLLGTLHKFQASS